MSRQDSSRNSLGRAFPSVYRATRALFVVRRSLLNIITAATATATATTTTTTLYPSIHPSIYRSIFLICLWLYSPLLDLGRFFSFLILYRVSRAPWTGDQNVARQLPKHRTQTEQTHTDIHALSRIRTEDFERPNTLHALYHAATMICTNTTA
jgi:hypothetical protein